MATASGRRKSAGSISATQGIASAGVGGGPGAGKRPSVGSAKSGGTVNRSRIDPSLMMSTNAKKSSEDVKNLAGGHAKHNKSSDRLHRMGGGGSSTNLTQGKRTKSYSQLVGAGSGASSSGKKKKRTERNEEEDGWTSSSQMGTPEQSRSPKSGSEEDDDDEEGLVMETKKRQGKTEEKGNLTTRKMPQDSEAGQEGKSAPLKRSDTQVTLRGFNKTPTQSTVPLPSDPSPPVLHKKEESNERRMSMQDDQTHSQAGSDDTLAHGSSTPDQDARNPVTASLSREEQRPAIDRGLSSASARTLTTQEPKGEHSSPASNRSRTSIRARTSLYPRESQGPAAPKLSTQYALAGALGSLQEDAELEQAMGTQRRRHLSDVGLANSRSEPGHLQDRSTDSSSFIRLLDNKSARRKSSISSIQSNTIKLPHASPSMADVSMGSVRAENSKHGSGSSALDAMQRASASGFQTLDERKQCDRRRTTSTQSLSAADAANLATRLRMARGESFDEAHTTSASKLLANSSSKFFTLSSRNDMSTTKAMKEYNKPVVSTFVKRLGERKNVEVKVEQGSLFDEDFARASLKGKGRSASEDEEREDEEDEGPVSVRYVMDFGLSGPAVHKTSTTEALLSTLLDHDEFEATWAPALANAAGLGEGTRKARDAIREGGGMDAMQLNGLSSTGGVAVNGPNATPMHFLHGLTNTTDAPFPLDASDMVVAAPDTTSAGLANVGEYLDAKNLRSIAMTWTALNVNKSHVVTRRYVDPMRESLERVGKAGGMTTSRWVSTPNSVGSGGAHHPHGHFGSNLTPNGGNNTPGGSLRWAGWRNLFSEHHTLREEA